MIKKEKMIIIGTFKNLSDFNFYKLYAPKISANLLFILNLKNNNLIY